MRSLCFLIFLFVSCGPELPIENPFEDNRPPPAIPTTSPETLSPLRILILDVGQGDATLVIGPDGKTVLIDGGPPLIGSQKIEKTLEEEGVAEIDEVVATHYDLDHIGGLPEILKRFPAVHRVIDRGDTTMQDLPLFQEYLALSNTMRHSAVAGDFIPLGDQARAHVIVVNGHYSDGRSIHLNPDEENESSIGLLIEYGDFRYFTAGDLTGGGSPGGYNSKDLETTAGEIIGDIDILRTGHHGSETSTNEKFLDLTKPEIAVISVGRDNDYGHPSPKVIRRLKNRKTGILRTDLEGTIEIQALPDNYQIMTER